MQEEPSAFTSMPHAAGANEDSQMLYFNTGDPLRSVPHPQLSSMVNWVSTDLNFLTKSLIPLPAMFGLCDSVGLYIKQYAGLQTFV